MQKTIGESKESKDCKTLLFRSNILEDQMLKPLFIDQSLRPQLMAGK